MEYRFDSKNHVHQLNVDGEWKPLIGTSSVGSVIAKPLTFWAAELAAVECLETGEHIPTIRQEYQEAASLSGPAKKQAIDALQRKYPAFKKARFAHFDRKNQAAEQGTDLHAEVERFVKDSMADNDGQTYDPKIQPFIDWQRENVKRFLASEIHGYSRELWVGGICDIVAELRDGTIAIIDIKSSKEAYASQFWQVAGYDILLTENGGFTPDGEKIFTLPGKVGVHIIFPFGAEQPTAQAVYDVESDREAFRAEVLLYKKLNLINEIKN